MIGAVWQMEAERRDDELNALWQLLGGGGDLFVSGLGDRREHVALLVALIQEACGQHRDPYVAERRALSDLAESLGVDPARCPTTDGLEREILEAFNARVSSSAAEADVRTEMDDALKTLSDDQRLQLIHQVSEGYAAMTESQQQAFADNAAKDLEIPPDSARSALRRGPAALLTAVKQPAGSSSHRVSKGLLSALTATAFGSAGFAALMTASAAVPFVAGPSAMLMLALIPKQADGKRIGGRKRARARKLIQIVVFIHAVLPSPITT